MKKTKAIAILIASLVVFATTLFALAENKNANTLFLDSDQDGLTDQEEKMIGTDSTNPDTDGDGYSDGKEVGSGYNPLKPAPGDKIVASAKTSDTKTEPASAEAAAGRQPDSETADLFSQLGENDLLSADAAADLTSDPENPNLTNEMIGQLLELTKEKAGSLETFAENPTFSSEDLAQVSQNALETVDIAPDLPEIADGELNILPPVDDKKLDEDEVKAEEKKQIEKYLAQAAFVLASNSPFAVENTGDLESNLETESANLITALVAGNAAKIEEYSARARTGIEQLKKIESPYVLKDIHKSMLQLAIYTVGLKDDISLNATDPMKSLAAASSLQAVAEKSMDIQSQLSDILKAYDIEFVNFP